MRHKKKALLKSANIVLTERTELEISTVPPSLLPTVDPPWKKPRGLNVFPDEINKWRVIAEKCTSEFTFKDMGDFVVYFLLLFVAAIPTICITRHLHNFIN